MEEARAMGSIRRTASRTMSRNRSTAWRMDDVFSGSRGGSYNRRSSRHSEEDEEALRWAALEKLPTYDRLRTTIMKSYMNDDDENQRGYNKNNVMHKEIDVTKLDPNERQQFIDRIFKVAEEDNEKFLMKFRNRIDKVGITLPTVEVRFERLTIEADCHIGDRALPSLANSARNLFELALGCLGISLAEKTKLTILKDVSGIIKPSRMALLLGPPSSGKTTLLLALAGKLDPSLKVKGEITYNGHKLNEFVPRKTSAYISQNDVHVGEMTVKETLDFSARCQGVGSRYELLTELARREKEAGIFPEAEVDLFMKATSMEGVESSLITDYTLRILGLDVCRDTIVGDEMIRGISGGQKKRVTTGEMIVGPTKTLFMDEISTGLDSSTTFQIVKCLQQIVHLTDATILMSLLQPAPETFDLFDDIILLSEGQIVYQGPREHVVEFFESCGFKCPERKGTADFLQEVTSKKDQEQYWADRTKPYRYISVTEFTKRFQRFHVGLRLENELSVPYDKSRSHKAALVFKKFLVSKKDLLKASWDKEWLLIQRNSFVYVFKTVQIIIVAFIGSTVFLRTRMHTRTEDDGAGYIGALLFCMLINMFNGFAELSLTIQRLPVFFKQRDLLFHPPWAFTLPTFLLRVPISVLETTVWMVISYYTIGFAPEASRFFKQFLLIFLVQQMAAGIFRVISGVCRTMIIANTGGALVLLLVFLLGGFILPKGQIPDWWEWAYWVSPMTYAYNAISVNEMFADRWMSKNASDNATKLGIQVLKNFDVPTESNWYWIGTGALVGFTVLLNVLFTLALMYLDPLGKPQAVISKETASEMEANQEDTQETPRLRTSTSKREKLPKSLIAADGNNTREMAMHRMNSRNGAHGLYRDEDLYRNEDPNIDAANGVSPKKGMVLPFTPLAMSFDTVNYYVDMPAEMKEQGVQEDRLQLLRGVTGAFRPGVLTALMGVSGAGKTTLMDVLAGRKTGGYIEGDIRISGFPKIQETFARISGYCEQTDIHTPQITIRESLIYSAFLRLPKEVSDEEKMTFVDQVMELVELDNLKDAIVGLPGITGLSTEQRKRLTIAVELVANPSIIFMDEPTSGLDARAAAIVMRTVRNTVDTGRTVVCTIHQPSIDIFEAFDELLLMKRGGQVIYAGPLGRNSKKVVEYFEEIPGVPKIPEKYNPATWMLEVSSIAAEARLGIDFAEHYKSSALHERNKGLVKELSTPPPGAKDLYFPTQYSQSTWAQFKSCLWKQWWSYWRSPDYNLVRYFFTLACALMVGTIFWKVGQKRESSTDLQTIIGAMYAAILFVGINNCSTVQPIVATERTVFYRETAAGMYSALPYAMAQVFVEIPYVLVQTTYYTLIVYAMVAFEWTAAKFFWFFFINFFSFLYFTYYGMMTVSITPNHQVAAIFAAAFYSLFNLFSGFFIPRPKIPKWWIWYYWICPMAWTVYGAIVSQYGDVEATIKVPGMSNKPTIKWYVEDHFGYDPNFMAPVAIVLVGFAAFFAFMYAYCLKTLNFQMR
ncbi:putative ABC-type xenobiotic transporter [Helianthus annuus]|nr:putative ABC-type xenobiotic transporter [Helianthus annuus]